jgi:hypothetical protein
VRLCALCKNIFPNTLIILYKPVNLFRKLFKKGATAAENEVQEGLKSGSEHGPAHNANNGTTVDSGYQDFVRKNFSFDATPQNFEVELHDSFRRYYADPALKFNNNLTDPQTGDTFEPHEAFNAVYNEWKTIHSSWDRRSLLFSFWDETELDKLAKWQVVQRYNNDRFPVKSFKFQEQDVKTEDLKDVRLAIALAKTHRLLYNLDDARKYIEYAYKCKPDHQHVVVEYANILHLSDNEADKERAHQLIQFVLNNKVAVFGKEIPLLNFFCFGEGYLDSSVFATLYLKTDNRQLSDWDAMAVEYYYCPVFRLEHAGRILSDGDMVKALAKLMSLTEEFPWFKPGVLEAKSFIEQLRTQLNNPQFMAKELETLDYYLSVSRG